MPRFAEASYEMTEGAMTERNSADAKLHVQFSLYPHPNSEKSAREGRPIFEDRLYVMIMVPGDKESIVHRPAYERDIQRFPRQYAAFKSRQGEAVIGTPLNMVPWLTGSQVKELEYFNVRTVEQLADVTDNLAAKMHGLQSLKRQAQDFLKAAKEAAPLVELRAELDKRDSQIEALQRQLAELGSKLEKQETKKEK